MSQEEVLAEIEKEIEKTKGQKDDDLEIEIAEDEAEEPKEEVAAKEKSPIVKTLNTEPKSKTESKNL